MSEVRSFRDVIELWPNRASLVRDLQAGGDQKKVAPVRDWHKHDAIPPIWFDPVLKACAHRGFDEITFRLLSELSKRDAGPR